MRLIVLSIVLLMFVALSSHVQADIPIDVPVTYIGPPVSVMTQTYLPVVRK